MLSGFMAESKEFFRRTPVHLRVAALLDHGLSNSPPDCSHRLCRPSLFESPLYTKTKSRSFDLLFVLAKDSNFDRNRVRGCNYGLEGGAFSMLGGCSSRFEWVHYSTREDSNKPQALKPAVFSFLLGLKPRFLCRPGI